MALRINLLTPNNFPQKSSKSQFSFKQIPRNSPNLHRISCAGEQKLSDSELAADLATEIGRIKTQALEKQEALRKSKEMLFFELCNYLGLDSEETMKKLGKSSEDEKLGLIRGFVTDWGVDFHPLSAKSVKQLVDEYLAENSGSDSSISSGLFPSIRKFMGFSQQDEE